MTAAKANASVHVLTPASMTPNKHSQDSSTSSASSFPKPLEIVCDNTGSNSSSGVEGGNSTPTNTSNSTSNSASNSASTSNDNKDAASKKTKSSSSSSTTPPTRTNCMPPSGPSGMVTFSKRVRVKKVRSYRNYTQAELDATWHTPEDYQQIKNLCIRTLKLMHSAGAGNFIDDDEWTQRGLEVRAKKAAQVRKENRAFATNAVLDEQDHQEALYHGSNNTTEGTTKTNNNNIKLNMERIRQVYLEISIPSQKVANEMANQDYLDVQEIIQNKEDEAYWKQYVDEYNQQKKLLQQQTKSSKKR